MTTGTLDFLEEAALDPLEDELELGEDTVDAAVEADWERANPAAGVEFHIGWAQSGGIKLRQVIDGLTLWDFAVEQALPKGGHRPGIARFAQVLLAAGLPDIDITGFTSDSGAEAFNVRLSMRRALAVRDALAASLRARLTPLQGAGVANRMVAEYVRHHVFVVPAGKARRTAPELSGANMSFDRRVEIRVSTPS